ncbi:MAG: hypothetical protein AAF149_05005 [Bacteroidota bacterium]
MCKQISSGDQITHTFQVKPEDLATFQDSNVHEVCSTFALAREIEWCSRKFVLKIKDDDHEGIGIKLNINHKSPAFLNNTVEIIASVQSFIENELICFFEARVGARIIADGITGQKLLKKSRIKEIFSTFDER